MKVTYFFMFHRIFTPPDAEISDFQRRNLKLDSLAGRVKIRCRRRRRRRSCHPRWLAGGPGSLRGQATAPTARGHVPQDFRRRTFVISARYTQYPILFEDRWLIAIHKPVGVLSHPNPGQSGRVAFEGTYHFEERRFNAPGGPIWLIHRLDQDTSGILLASKNVLTARKCRDEFEKQRIRKLYLALVAGKPRPPSGAWYDHLQKRSGRGMVRSCVLRGRPPNAELRYMVGNLNVGAVADGDPTRKSIGRLHESPSATAPTFPNNLSLLQITLITGRTHQIRVQAAARGHPVAGDRVYGDFQFNRELRAGIGLKRLFLHAWKLEFRHPATARSLNLEAHLPEALKECLERLKR